MYTPNSSPTKIETFLVAQPEANLSDALVHVDVRPVLLCIGADRSLIHLRGDVFREVKLNAVKLIISLRADSAQLHIIPRLHQLEQFGLGRVLEVEVFFGALLAKHVQFV